MTISVLFHVWLISGIHIFGDKLDAVRNELSISLFAKAKEDKHVKAVLPEKVEKKKEIKPVEQKKAVHKVVPVKKSVIKEEKVSEEIEVTSDEAAPEPEREPVIEAVSEPAAVPASVYAEPAVVEAPTPTFDREAYNNSVRSIIEANKIYPPIARRRGIEGTVLISFTILKDGSISDLYLDKASGFKQLDDAAYKIIRKSSPFPPPPEEISFSLPVTFEIR